MSSAPRPFRCHGGKTRMHARLLLSHDIFSFEKKPVTCGVGGRVNDVVAGFETCAVGIEPVSSGLVDRSTGFGGGGV